MKHQQKGHIPLLWKLMIWIIAASFALLSLTMAVTLRYTLRSFQSKIDDILLSTVQTLAESPTVIQITRTGVCDPEMADFLYDVVVNTGDLDYITIADRDSVRIYHIDPAFIGREGAKGHGETITSSLMGLKFRGKNICRCGRCEWLVSWLYCFMVSGG